ncbi:MAG: hypothetical protein JKX78_13810 [Alteromonadaceae bacterium]|nr:hypothetical protein [Alteromonadaceae bacterium]
MKAPLYDEILTICQLMAQASAADDEKASELAHQSLQKLCQTNQGTPKDHPLQWEALADFTHDGDQALDIYQLALNSAEKLNLVDAKASIFLAMAQRYHEFEEKDKTVEFSNKANDLIAEIKNDELKDEISSFINSL